MVLKTLPVDAASPGEADLEEAVCFLKAGGIVALPTETFYGLAADAFDAAALERVHRLKGKSADDPILLLLADRSQADQVTDAVPPLFEALAERFWPGPLTLIVPAGPGVPRAVTGGRGSVAVRVPGLALPRRLAAALGRPLSGVSANRTGRPPCRTARQVADTWRRGVDLVLDGGPAAGSAPSTLLDLVACPPRVLREGWLPKAALRPFLEEV